MLAECFTLILRLMWTVRIWLNVICSQKPLNHLFRMCLACFNFIKLSEFGSLQFCSTDSSILIFNAFEVIMPNTISLCVCFVVCEKQCASKFFPYSNPSDRGKFRGNFQAIGKISELNSLKMPTLLVQVIEKWHIRNLFRHFTNKIIHLRKRQ